MRLHEIAPVNSIPNLIYRWIDERGCMSYLRSNAMIGRVRHFIPRQLSGEFHSNFKTGLSFALDDRSWLNVGTPICFVVRRNALGVPVVNINGQAIYDLSGAEETRRTYSMDQATYQQYLKNAIEDSKTDPTEAFVIGNIRDLATKLERIHVRPDGDNVSPKGTNALRAYCQQYNIPLIGLD